MSKKNRKRKYLIPNCCVGNHKLQQHLPVGRQYTRNQKSAAIKQMRRQTETRACSADHCLLLAKSENDTFNESKHSSWKYRRYDYSKSSMAKRCFFWHRHKNFASTIFFPAVVYSVFLLLLTGIRYDFGTQSMCSHSVLGTFHSWRLILFVYRSARFHLLLANKSEIDTKNVKSFFFSLA